MSPAGQFELYSPDLKCISVIFKGLWSFRPKYVSTHYVSTNLSSIDLTFFGSKRPNLFKWFQPAKTGQVLTLTGTGLDPNLFKCFQPTQIGTGLNHNRDGS